MWFRRFAPAVVLTVGWVSFSTAQFDADQSGVGQSTTVQSSGPDELVRQLRSLASRGGDDRARATASLIRVGAWTEAASQLEKIGEEKDNAVVASSARTIGAALLLRVSLREEMTEAAQKAIEKMSQMLDQSDQAPEKLTAAIAALANSSVDQNLAANRTLLRGGKAAIVEMVKAIGQGLPQQQFEKVVQVLKRFGQEGTDAVGELALYGNANVRANALVAYQSLADREMALAWSFAARFASNATAAEVEVGKRLTSGHSAGDALVYLLDRLRQLRRDALRTPNDQSPATMWAIAEEASSVSASRSTELYRCYRKAYDLAQQIRRLPNLTPDALRNVIAADLSYRIMADLDWGDESQVDAVMASYGGLVDDAFLLATLTECQAEGDEPAALGVIRILAVKPASEQLRGNGDQRSALVAAATSHPSPRVRYEATMLVTELANAGDKIYFAGSSEVQQSLAEMASLSNQPSAVLVETRPVVAVRQEVILGELGHEVRLATNAMQAERAVADGGDLRMVVSKIQLTDASAVELVDRIRRLPRGRLVPIVFFSDDSVHPDAIAAAKLESRSTRWTGEQTPAVVVVPLPGGPAAFAEVIAEIESKQRLAPLAPSDRARFRNYAQTALQSVSNRP